MISDSQDGILYVCLYIDTVNNVGMSGEFPDYFAERTPDVSGRHVHFVADCTSSHSHSKFRPFGI